MKRLCPNAPNPKTPKIRCNEELERTNPYGWRCPECGWATSYMTEAAETKADATAFRFGLLEDWQRQWVLDKIAGFPKRVSEMSPEEHIQLMGAFTGSAEKLPNPFMGTPNWNASDLVREQGVLVLKPKPPRPVPFT